MSDGLTTVISLVQHIPWPWVGLPLPHPTLFLLTIPTLLTLQESLMKRCLFLSSQCLPVTGNSTHTGMFVHAYIYTHIYIYCTCPSPTIQIHTFSCMCSLEHHVHRVAYGKNLIMVDTEVCASVTGSQGCYYEFLDHWANVILSL